MHGFWTGHRPNRCCELVVGARLGEVAVVQPCMFGSCTTRGFMDFVLAESSIVGAAIGLSLSGLRPVCEIPFESFIYPAMNQLTTQAARMQLRLGDDSTLPLVVRVPYGGGFGGVEHHSESNEALFTAIAGLSVAVCSSAHDAGMLLETATLP